MTAVFSVSALNILSFVKVLDNVVPIMTHETTMNYKKQLFQMIERCENKKTKNSPSVIVKFNAYVLASRRRWSSGMMAACHAADPGSIPGRRTFFLRKF